MIGTSIRRTLSSLTDPGVLVILALPFLVASLIWILLLFFLWGSWSGWMESTALFQWLLTNIGNNFVFESLKILILILSTAVIFGPLWYLTYILIIALALFPMLLPRIQKRFYPGLQKKRGGSTWGSLKNAVVGTSVFVIGFGLSLPLWVFTPLAPAVNLILTAYLNKKIFSYDVLQDYASADEMKKFTMQHSSDLWVLGLLTSFLAFVPLANIVAPALTALCFIHYGLATLEIDSK